MSKRSVAASLVAGSLLFWELASSQAKAQVVQLPTVGVTSAATTVSVPDRGGILLGGVGRSSSGSVSRGIGPGRLLGNRASGSSVSGGTMSVHATIIDLDELDAAVLAEAARRREAVGLAEAGRSSGSSFYPAALTGSPAELTGKAAFLSRNTVRRSDAFDPTISAAATGASHESIGRTEDRRAIDRIAASDPSNEVFQLMQEADKAARAGKKGAARVYYQMAQRRAEGPLKLEIGQRLALLDKPAESRLAARQP